jgi:hypothetical protein
MDKFDEEYEVALERGKIEMATKPRAIAVRYDEAIDRLIIELANGSVFHFPPRLAQGLETATSAQIGAVEILGVGFGLHWEELDADHRVEDLLAGRFGSRRYMVERFGPYWQLNEAA